MQSKQRKEINIKTEIRKIKNKQTKINGEKHWFFENINKIDKPLARQNKKEKLQITNIRNETRDITIDAANTKSIIREYYKQFCTNKVDNLDEMNPLLKKKKPTITIYSIKID